MDSDLITVQSLMRMSPEALITGWNATDEAPGYLAISFQLPGNTIFCGMARDTIELRIRLGQMFIRQTMASKRGELAMKSTGDGWKNVTYVDDGMVMELEGNIDCQSAMLICAEINAALNNEKNYAVLNMSAVNRLDHGAITFFLGFSYGIESRGRVVMTAVKPTMHEQITLFVSCFEEHVSIFNTDSEAHDALKFDV